MSKIMKQTLPEETRTFADAPDLKNEDPEEATQAKPMDPSKAEGDDSEFIDRDSGLEYRPPDPSKAEG